MKAVVIPRTMIVLTFVSATSTVLSSLACECGLLEHVFTQVPYVIVTVIISTLFGTIPIGYGAWPNIVGILLGVLLLVAFVYIVCVPVISPAGRFDIFTEMYLRVWDSADLIQLKVDTAKAYNGEHPTDGDVEVSDQAGANPKHEEADKVMENSEECDEECDEDEETSGKEIAV